MITDSRDRCLYEVNPYIEIYINGPSFTVAGFANIYNLLSSGTTKYPRVWNALIKRVNLLIEGNEEEIGILSEENKEYLTKVI